MLERATMALIAHQTTPGSYASFPTKSKLWTKEVKCKQIVSLQLVGRFDRNSLSSRRFGLSLRAPTAKAKRLKVSAFKGSAQNDESRQRNNGTSKVPKNSIKLSLISQDEETISESPDTQNIKPLSYDSSSEEKVSVSGSPAIQNLFKKWLIMLRTTQSPSNQSSNSIFGDGQVETDTDISKTQTLTQKQDKGKLLKAAWCYFWNLDATIKAPLLIFLPMYLTVNLIYGPEVSKELTPMWIFGPIIIALYVKLLQGLCALYVFSFKQTVKVIKSLPSYYRMGSSYLAQGTLKDDIYTHVWKPMVAFKNLDYKKVVRRMKKWFGEWAAEKYLDFVESIWPYYCRTIRFLKKANLI